MGIMKKEICIFLQSPSYIQYFFDSQLCLELPKRFNVTILVPQNLAALMPIPDLMAIKYINYDESRPYLLDFCRRVFAYKYRNKSKSFLFREMRDAEPFSLNGIFRYFFKKNQSNSPADKNIDFLWADKQNSKSNNLCAKLRKIAWLLFDKVLMRYFARMLSIYPNVVKIIIRKWPIPPQFFVFLKSEFDLVMMPTAGMSNASFFMAKLTKKLQIPLVFLIDNWDNLSSKSILLQLPDYMTTWGEQSTYHAVNIHGMPKERVFNLGAMRMSNYRELRATKYRKLFHSQYVLYCGSFFPFDEFRCLKTINDVINNDRELYGDITIIYKPHPENKNNISIKNLNNVKHVNEYLNVFDDKSIASDQARRAVLISNAKFIITGPGSMIVESSIFGKNVIVMAHPEKWNLTSPKRFFGGMEHFKGIERLPNINLCKDLVDLSFLFRLNYLAKNILQKEIDEVLSYYIDLELPDYHDKLSNITQTILAKT